MYTNPFNRKHSMIRQVIDRFLHPDYNNNKSKSSSKESLKRDEKYLKFNNNNNTKSSSNLFGHQRKTTLNGK